MKFVKLFLASSILFFSLPVLAMADYQDQRVNFFVESSYDKQSSSQVYATLKKIGNNAYFYVEDTWWNSLDAKKKDSASAGLNSLASEFDSKIYPILTSQFGSERKPGIDNDNRITVLISPMKGSIRGYFRNNDEYERNLMPNSNQREMVYFNADYLSNSFAKSFLAHEFTHLIQFNQKDLAYDVTDDTWLAEARSEFAITLLGYNNSYDQSNLKIRVQDFLDYPFDSLTEWRGQTYDYGVVNLFVHYLVEQYGVEILSDSLHSPQTGTASINQYIKDHDPGMDFNKVFNNWGMAVLLNDCSLGEKYCYKSPALSKVRIVPFNNFLPFSGDSALSLGQTMTEWSCHWQKFTGGKDGLKIDFRSSSPSANFKVNYLIEDKFGNISISSLTLDKNKKAQLLINDFSGNDNSIIIIPCLDAKSVQTAADSEQSFTYYLNASTVAKTPDSGNQGNNGGTDGNNDQGGDTGNSTEVKLPFTVSKPLAQMSTQELLMVVIRLILWQKGLSL